MTHLCPTCGEPCDCTEEECGHCLDQPAELDFEDGEPDEEWIERMHGGGDD